MVTELHVLLKLLSDRGTECRVVKVPAHRNEKVSTFIERLVELKGLRPAKEPALILNGVKLEQSSKLSDSNLAATADQDRTATGYAYPNGWFSWASRRTIPIMTDGFWPGCQHFSMSSTMAAAAAAAGSATGASIVHLACDHSLAILLCAVFLLGWLAPAAMQ